MVVNSRRVFLVVGSRLLTSCTLSVVLIGCGGAALPETVRLTGQVTFDDGPCPASGTVYFTPVGASKGLPMRPATAEFGTDGMFSVKSFEGKEGLIPGKYLIRIDCWETPPNFDGKPVKSHVSSKYQNAETSGLEVTVEPGSKPRELKLKIQRES